MNNGTKLIPEISADGVRIAERLSGLEPGDFISYADLSSIIGVDVRTGGRSALISARKYVLRDHQIVMAPVRGQGLRRMTDGEIASCGTVALKKVNGTARRGMQQLGAIQQWERLTQEERARHNASMTMLAVFYETTKARSVKAIEAVVTEMGHRLPLKEALQQIAKMTAYTT